MKLYQAFTPNPMIIMELGKKDTNSLYTTVGWLPFSLLIRKVSPTTKNRLSTMNDDDVGDMALFDDSPFGKAL